MNTVLLAFAFVFFVLGTFLNPNPAGVSSPWWGRFNPISAGLACWVLTELLGHWPR
jgi:uncharacterized membrane protein